MTYKFTTRSDAVEWLGARYDEQVRLFPRLAKISRSRYIRTNLRTAMKILASV